jgi:hypothetical protein
MNGDKYVFKAISKMYLNIFNYVSKVKRVVRDVYYLKNIYKILIHSNFILFIYQTLILIKLLDGLIF